MMDNETRQIMFSVFMGALVLISFIGGCSYTVKNGQENNLKRTCIQSNASWQDGNCVR
jgi:hypothetical protein